MYSGSSLSNLTLVACNDDANGTVQSQVSGAVTAGQTYYLQAGGYGSGTGDLKLTVSAVAGVAIRAGGQVIDLDQELGGPLYFQTNNSTTTSYTYDAANCMLTASSTTYGYDTNGNQTGKTAGGATTSYSYDALNRMTGISGPATASYSYNGDGLRVGKTVNGTTTPYVWDPTGMPMVLSDGNEYVWGQGMISAISAGGVPSYAHADGLGSIRMITDPTGAVIGRQTYDAFGAARSQTGVQLPMGYTGEQVDPESGLVYLRARYMDPATGRFMSKDPLRGVDGIPLTQNAYLYGIDGPLAYTDPSGDGPAQLLGIDAHKIIEDYYLQNHPTWQAEARVYNTAGTQYVRPNLVEPSSGLFYEIKPAWQQKQGADQIGRYRGFGTSPQLQPNSESFLGATLPTSCPAVSLTFWQDKAVNGLVLYTWLPAMPWGVGRVRRKQEEDAEQKEEEVGAGVGSFVPQGFPIPSLGLLQ